MLNIDDLDILCCFNHSGKKIKLAYLLGTTMAPKRNALRLACIKNLCLKAPKLPQQHDSLRLNEALLVLILRQQQEIKLRMKE